MRVENPNYYFIIIHRFLLQARQGSRNPWPEVLASNKVVDIEIPWNSC